MAQVRLSAGEVLTVPRLAEYGFASNPPPGSDAVLVFYTGDRSNGVVVATGSQALRLKNLASGDSALYDSRGAYVWLTPNGIVINGNGGNVTVENAADVTVTGSGTIQLSAPSIKLN